MKEIWKPIKGYEGLYEISNFGYVITLKTGKILQPVVNKSGAVSVILSKESKRKSYLLKRLMIDHFTNEKKYTSIVFLDGNKNNHHISNLKAVSRYITKVCENCNKEFLVDSLQTWAKHKTCRKCKSVIWLKQNPGRKREIASAYVKRESENLTNLYIIGLFKKSGVAVHTITPELIETKRQIIKIKRLCKQLQI